MTWRVNVIQSTSKKNLQTTASWVTRKKERDAAELTERVWMQNQIYIYIYIPNPFAGKPWKSRLVADKSRPKHRLDFVWLRLTSSDGCLDICRGPSPTSASASSAEPPWLLVGRAQWFLGSWNQGEDKRELKAMGCSSQGLSKMFTRVKTFGAEPLLYFLLPSNTEMPMTSFEAPRGLKLSNRKCSAAFGGSLLFWSTACAMERSNINKTLSFGIHKHPQTTFQLDKRSIHPYSSQYINHYFTGAPKRMLYEGA